LIYGDLMDTSVYDKHIAELEREIRILNQKLKRSESERKVLEEALETHSCALKARNSELEESRRIIMESESKYRNLAQHDMLTGLANRFSLYEQLNKNFISENNNYGSLLYLDLDRFKSINDNFGHDAGDTILCQTAKRLLSCVRKEDVVSRIGGDEFAIVLPQIKESPDLVQIVERIISEIAEPYNIGKESFLLGISIGISMYPADGRDPEDLLCKADMAMYSAKKSDFSGYQFYHNIE
jgi:diguanylate cyclase (GGDEF)-like protein